LVLFVLNNQMGGKFEKKINYLSCRRAGISLSQSMLDPASTSSLARLNAETPEQIELSRQHLNQIQLQWARMPDDDASRMVVAAGHDSFRNKVNYMVGELAKCRDVLKRNG
jgi:hypothetical protein